MSAGAITFRVMVSLGALPPLGMATLLFATAQTAAGRWMGAASLLLMGGLLFWLWRPAHGRRAAVVLALGALCWGSAWWITPSASEVQATGLSIYLDEPGHSRAAITNLVPEVDQFTLGSFLISFVDPVIDPPQAERIRTLFQEVYRELRADPAFERAGSTMGTAYADLFLGGPDNAHLYRYPAESDGPARPVLLFMHGFGGNFLGYLWVLKRFADAHGWAVVAPDNGAGLWRPGPSKRAIERTLAYIDARPDLDGRRIILAGLSNGGLGVARALRQAPRRFESVVLFSAVTGLIDQGVPRQLPWYILHGATDRRIPAGSVRATAQRLRASGAPVHLVMRPTDHFLFFEDHNAVDAILARATGRR